MSARPSDAGDGKATITRLVAQRVVDSELAALLWLMLDAGISLVVSGRPGSGRDALAAALEQLVGQSARTNGGSGRAAWLLEAESLEAVFDQLAGPEIALQADQLRLLGLVVIVRDVAGLGGRVVAAHYVRPPERDAGGHVQRRPPAILAALDERAGRLDHFAWGVLPELAERSGLSNVDFDRRLAARRELIDRLVGAGELSAAQLRAAVSAMAEGERH
jgi:hypothetical protein